MIKNVDRICISGDSKDAAYDSGGQRLSFVLHYCGYGPAAVMLCFCWSRPVWERKVGGFFFALRFNWSRQQNLFDEHLNFTAQIR